ncbi:MAG: nucleoside triphosphate pyrophosphohydrolase [Bacilli bacterium]|nr:nucleoside triphosphate pyrophosphohydrolase [Bacilli bacterium]
MPLIHVIGLGPGSWASLPVGSYQLMQSGLPLFLRTSEHPVVAELAANGIKFGSYDFIYQQSDTFEEVYQQIVGALLSECMAAAEQTIIYAVPGHPGVAERTVPLLKQQAACQGVQVVVGAGQSFLDELLIKVGADPTDGLIVLDALSVQASQLNPGIHTVFVQVYSRAVASDLKLTLMDVYPDEFPVTVVKAAGVKQVEEIKQLPLFELDQTVEFDHLTSVYIAPAGQEQVLHRQIWKLLDIVRILRSPEGCPWDRKQTHESLRKYVIEEAYEVADAIDRREPWDLAEELGDLLLHVALHAQIGTEQGTFSFYDIVQILSDKMVRRHPHVFGGGEADTVEDVLTNWESIKQQEKSSKQGAPDELKAGSILDQVKPSAPQVQVALQLQARAAEVGFDWTSLPPVVEKIIEELDEVTSAAGDVQKEDELGDLLFAVCNLARFLNVDPEAALAKTNMKFRDRFRYIETELSKKGISPAESTLEEMDALWTEAKTKKFR